MNIKKIKKPSPLGTPFTWLALLYSPPDSKTCLSCNKEFKVGDMILIEKKAVYPKEKLEDLKFKITGKTYCLKCAQDQNRTGLHVLIEKIYIKKEPEDHAPKHKEPREPEPPTREGDPHDTDKA